MIKLLRLLQSVQKVLSNLLIAHVELRSEESIDIQPYTHERKVEKIVVPMSEELKDAQEELLQVSSNLNDQIFIAVSFK